jgi:hypothetical protein
LAPTKVKIYVDGEWDIDDLFYFVETFRDGYSLFYHLASPENMDLATRDRFRTEFWSGSFAISSAFIDRLHNRLPKERQLRVVEIKYASPGWFTFAGVLVALRALVGVLRVWVKFADEAFELYKKIDDWFEAKKLKRVANNFNAEQFPSSSVNEATDLCYEFGDLMGLDRRFIENTIDVTGNPISALRLLASLAKEARRIDTLVAQGKLRLPEQI